MIMSNNVPQHLDGFASVFLSDDEVIPVSPCVDNTPPWKKRKKTSGTIAETSSRPKSQVQQSESRTSALERLQRLRKKKNNSRSGSVLPSCTPTESDHAHSMPSLYERVTSKNSGFRSSIKNNVADDDEFSFDFSNRSPENRLHVKKGEKLSARAKTKHYTTCLSDSDDELPESGVVVGSGSGMKRGQACAALSPHDSSDDDLDFNFPISPRGKLPKRSNPQSIDQSSPSVLRTKAKNRPNNGLTMRADSDAHRLIASTDCNDLRLIASTDCNAHTLIKRTGGNALRESSREADSDLDSFCFPVSHKRARRTKKGGDQPSPSSSRSRVSLDESKTNSRRVSSARAAAINIFDDKPPGVSPARTLPVSPAIPIIPLDSNSHVVDLVTPSPLRIHPTLGLTDSDCRRYGLDTPTRRHLAEDDSFLHTSPMMDVVDRQEEKRSSPGQSSKRARRRKRLEIDSPRARPAPRTSRRVSSDDVYVIDDGDAVRIIEQTESDEALARRLQEEMDREFAASLANDPQSPHVDVPDMSDMPPVVLGSPVISPHSYQWSMGRHITSPPMRTRAPRASRQLTTGLTDRPNVSVGTLYTRMFGGRRSRSRSRAHHRALLDYTEHLMNAQFNLNRVARGRGNGRMASPGNDYEELLQLAESLGDVKQKGLNQREIDRLPTRSYVKQAPGDGEEDPTCNVCFCEFENGEAVRMLPCLHEFHTGCIDKWIKTNATCPICRLDVTVS